MSKIVTCSICRQSTALYRVERDQFKAKKYVCSKHPKKIDGKVNPINKEKHDKLDKFYQHIHEKFNYTCQETGKKLEYSNKHVLHLLPKSKYPYFALDTRNAILASWSTHSIVDKGGKDQRTSLKIWKSIQNTRKKLLEEVGMEFDAQHWEIITY